MVADLAMAQVGKVRSELPVLAHRRPEAYRWPDDNHRGTVGTDG